MESIIDAPSGLNVAIIGMGNLGRAITGYFRGKRTNMNAIAALDVDPQKVDKVVAGVKCYHLDQMRKLEERAGHYDRGVDCASRPGCDGDCTSGEQRHKGNNELHHRVRLMCLTMSHLEEFDMITSIEKVALLLSRRNRQPAASMRIFRSFEEAAVIQFTCRHDRHF
ncbi:MAG: hypothetical protein MZV63_28210 [Marinilabiliales bacterium]|nr:hypothetical protein [Marinilabiliales bacterium]